MPCGQGQLLRRKVSLGASLLETACTRVWDHERLAEIFPVFLLTIHGSVRATVPLMMAAVAELRRRPPDDPLRSSLIEYFERHAREEAEHEEWLLQDLEALGLSRSGVLARIGAAPVATLVGAQYYWIHHAHPVALLGFFAVLEGHPPTLAHLAEVQRRTGVPADALRMLRDHAQLDLVHGDELFQFIDWLPLEPVHIELLGMSALHTISALADLFTSLLPPKPGHWSASAPAVHTGP
ncbi:MAG: iron-containing redox enzyme family protein [Vicinamibacterales bacterium]